MDVARGEHVEGELDVFITRRHDQRVRDEGERLTEEAWAESVRRQEAQRREENRALWHEYHRAAAERARRTLEALIRDHEAAAEMLEQDQTRGDAA